MTQSQFMYELMSHANDLPDDEKYALMSEYDRLFTEKKESGMNESEIIAQLPPPEELAHKYLQSRGGLSEEQERGKADHPFTALGVLFFILLIPVLIVYEVLVFTLGLLLAVLMLALCIAAAFGSIAGFGISSLSHGFILLGIGGLFVTVALVLFSAAYFRGAASALAWFPAMMGRTLRFRGKGAA